MLYASEILQNLSIWHSECVFRIMVYISVLSWRQFVIITLPSESRVQKPCHFGPFYSLFLSSSFHFVCHFLVFLCSCNFPYHTWKTVWWMLLLYICSMVYLVFSVMLQPALLLILHSIFFPFPLIKKEENSICQMWSLFWSQVQKRSQRSPPVIPPLLKGTPNLPCSQMSYNSISPWVVFAWGESSLESSFLLKGYWTSVIKKAHSLWPTKVQSGVLELEYLNDLVYQVMKIHWVNCKSRWLQNTGKHVLLLCLYDNNIKTK